MNVYREIVVVPWSVLTARMMILRHDILLLMLLHVYRLRDHLCMTDGVHSPIVVLHKQALRVNAPVMNNILRTRVMLIELSKVITYLDRIS